MEAGTTTPHRRTTSASGLSSTLLPMTAKVATTPASLSASSRRSVLQQQQKGNTQGGSNSKSTGRGARGHTSDSSQRGLRRPTAKRSAHDSKTRHDGSGTYRYEGAPLKDSEMVFGSWQLEMTPPTVWHGPQSAGQLPHDSPVSSHASSHCGNHTTIHARHTVRIGCSTCPASEATAAVGMAVDKNENWQL